MQLSSKLNKSANSSMQMCSEEFKEYNASSASMD
jgi:hypothetical protein